MIPYIIFLVAFLLYSNYFFILAQQNMVINIISFCIIVGLSGYLLSNELTQLMEDKLDYFKSVWNYIDILPPVLATSCAFLILVP